MAANDSQDGSAAAGDLDIVLGDLGSRSQGKPLTLGGAPPVFVVVGTDSRSNSGYAFLTDVNYNSSGGENESIETGFSTFQFSRTLSTTFDGRNGVFYLRSDGNCTHTNTGPNGRAFCSIFGPEIWTEPFDADAGKALALDYAASASDNYEVYGFLVAVNCTDSADPATCDYGGGQAENATDPLDTHSLFLHRRGKRTPWTTAVGLVPATGTYRFRFVDGAFDQTGGRALGTDFYIDPASVVLGDAQTIDFTDPGDRVVSAGDFVVSPTATSGLPVELVSATTGVCSLSAPVAGDYTVTPNTVGTCVLVADAPSGSLGGTDFAAAPTEVRFFSIINAPTAPTNSGLPTIFGTPQTGETLSSDEGTWGTGGAPITATDYQWVLVDGGVDTDISGATSQTFCIPDEYLGLSLKLRVTQTNSVGSTSAESVATPAITAGGSSCPVREVSWTDGDTDVPSGASAGLPGASDWVFAPAGDGTGNTTVGFVSLATAQSRGLVSGAPPGLTQLTDLFGFTLISGAAGSSTTVSIDFGEPIPPGSAYWKYGVPVGESSPRWYQFSQANFDYAAGRVTLTLTDGGIGDSDGLPNSVINDPGAVFSSGATAVPALNRYALLSLGLGLLGIAAWYRRQAAVT